MAQDEVEQRGALHQRGGQAGRAAGDPARGSIGEQDAAEREQRGHRPHRPFARTQQLQGNSHRPVHERRFLKIVHAVELRGHPVAAGHHFAGNLRIPAFIGIGQRTAAEAETEEHTQRQRQQEEIVRPGRRGGGLGH